MAVGIILEGMVKIKVKQKTAADDKKTTAPKKVIKPAKAPSGARVVGVKQTTKKDNVNIPGEAIEPKVADNIGLTRKIRLNKIKKRLSYVDEEVIDDELTTLPEESDDEDELSSVQPEELPDLLPADEQLTYDRDQAKNKIDQLELAKFARDNHSETQVKDLKQDQAAKAHRLTVYKRLALAFSALVFFVLMGVLYLTMVKATIAVALKEQTINDQASFQIYDRGADFALPDKALRGLVKVATVEQSKLYQVSGSDVIGEEVVGQITLINKYNKSQPLVASTRLLSASGKLYRLKNSVTVPAGGQVIADIYADLAKPESAVGAETFTVPGLWEGLQDKIYGQSAVGAIKYQQKLRRIISQDDIDKALADIKQVLIDKVKADYDNAYNDYDYKIYHLDEATLSFVVSGKVGEEKEQLPVSMKAVVEVVAFNNTQAQDLAKAGARAKLPADQDLIDIDKNSLHYELTKFDPNAVMAEVNLAYSANTRANNKTEVIDKNKIIGLSEDQLKLYLNNNKDIQNYTIEFYPSFIKQVPRLTDRIEIKVIE